MHANAAQGLPLAVVEAPVGEVPDWLDRGVPLLTSIELSPARADGDTLLPPQVRWIILSRREDGAIEACLHDADRSWTREVQPDALAAELGLDVETRRWVRVEKSLVGAHDGEESATYVKPTPMRRLLGMLRPDRGDLIAVVVFAVAIGVLLLATPIAVQALVNFVAQGGAIPPLLVVAALLFMGLCGAGVLTALQTWIVEILQRRIFVRSVAEMAARLPQVALDSGNSRYGPELVNRFFDLETIQKRGSFLLLDGLSVLLSVTIGLVLLAFYHPILLAFDILLLLAIMAIIVGPVRRGVVTAKAESSAKYEVAAWLEEIARNPILFKSSGVMRSVFERTDSLARKYIEKRDKHFRIVFGQGIAALALQVLASAVLLGIGGYLVMIQSLTLGQLVAAELIVTQVVSSVAKTGKHLEAFYDLMAATEKVGMVFDVPVERPTGEHYLPGGRESGANLEFSSVSWAAPGSSPLFSDVSCEVSAGECVGISGLSGSGKSTLLRLAWGMLEPTRGSIRVDGRDLRELSLQSLRRTALLLDRVELLEGTVHENVQLSRPFVSDDDVRAALDSVGLADDVARFPEGVSTHLAADGRPFSAGQAVRLQLARTIACRPRLLLVSDFFGELSEEERNRVFDVLFDENAPWTLVFVSNNPDVLARCNRTFVLKGGSLAPAELNAEPVAVS